MLRKYTIPLLLFLLMNLHEIENTKSLKRKGNWYSNIDKIKDTSRKFFNASLSLMLLPNNPDDYQLKQNGFVAPFVDISSLLNKLMLDTKNLLEAVDEISLNIKINVVGQKIADAIERVEKFYNMALDYSSDLNYYNREELKDKEGDMMCGDETSPSQYLYNFYKIVITTEIMGQVAETFGYYLQHGLYKVSVDFQLEKAHKKRQKILEKYFRKFKKYIKAASTQSRPCDPKDLKRDENFIEMEKLYRIVIARDKDLIKEDSCRGECSDIDKKNFNGHRHMPFLCRRLHKCHDTGRWSFCALQNDENARLYLEDLERWDNPRIYDWIRDDDGNVYGENKNTCQGDEITVEKNYLYYGYECETCICTCEGTDKLSIKGRGVEVFSLRPSRSNTDKNMVVTGIKFRREYSIICIQIKEGKLLPGGEIEKESEKWIDDCNINFATFKDTRTGNSSVYKEGKDYVIIEEKYNYIDLEDVIAEDGWVVTGVSFTLSKPCKGGDKHLKLKLESMQFNFSSSELMCSRKTHSSPTCHRFKIIIDDAMSPLKQPKPINQTIIRKSNSFISFGVSSFKEDAGQTTLPFLDAQAVETNPSAPLTSVGLFYKATPRYGGFLAFRINTLNYGDYMEGLDTID